MTMACDLLVTKVRYKDIPDSDRGDFRYRRVVDLSSFSHAIVLCNTVKSVIKPCFLPGGCHQEALSLTYHSQVACEWSWLEFSPDMQYIPRNMLTVTTLLCSGGFVPIISSILFRVMSLVWTQSFDCPNCRWSSPEEYLRNHLNPQKLLTK